MKSGVAAPEVHYELDGLGDRLLNAEPPINPGKGPSFPALPAEETMMGATDPRSVLVEEAGTPRPSGEKSSMTASSDEVCLGFLGSRVLQGLLEVLPLRSKTKEGRDGGSLFPLPTSRVVLKNLFPNLSDEGLSWLVGVCVSLNSLWGCCEFGDGVVTPCQRRCLMELEKDVNRILQLEMKIPGFSWKEFFQTRHIDYQGEEVKVAKRFCWENIRHALPDEIGRVPLRQVCTQGAKHFVDNIDLFIKPRDLWGKVPKPKVMVADKDWGRVCAGLVSCGLCCILPREEVFDTGDGPLLNGMFGVTKDEWVDSTEVYRLIMNLIPFNLISESLSGDIATLPTWASMNPLFLQPSVSAYSLVARTFVASSIRCRSQEIG